MGGLFAGARAHGLVVAVLLLVCVERTAPAQMQAPPPDLKSHRHEGVYVRLYIGPAYTRMTASEAGSDYAIKGSGGAFGIAVGWAIKDNLILYGQLFDDIAMDPTVERDGVSTTANDTAAGVVGPGIGLTYYLMPTNLYLSATLGMTQLTIQEDGEEVGETDFGPGLSAMFGKEWWVSANWGLGLAGQAFFGSMKDKGGSPTWTTTAFAVVFSATYN